MGSWHLPECLQSAFLHCYYICTSQLNKAKSMKEDDITIPISQVRIGSETVSDSSRWPHTAGTTVAGTSTVPEPGLFQLNQSNNSNS